MEDHNTFYFNSHDSTLAKLTKSTIGIVKPVMTGFQERSFGPLLVSLLSLSLLACYSTSGSNSIGTGSSGSKVADALNSGDSISGRGKSSLYPSGGMIVPSPMSITNPYLDDASAKKKVKNVLMNAYPHDNGDFILNYSEGEGIKEAIYGTLDLVWSKAKRKFVRVNRTKYSTLNFGAFARTDGRHDNKTNSIIQIKTGKKGWAPYNYYHDYYYNHIDGKQFTQFLPSANKLEILALASSLDTNIFYSKRYTWGEDYIRLRNYVEAAKNHTFKGFALAGFASHRVVTPQIAPSIEVDLYPATFILTFNSLFTWPKDLSAQREGNYFSMVINLAQDVEEVKKQTISEAKTVVVEKAAVRSIHIKDFSFLADNNTATVYSEIPSYYHSDITIPTYAKNQVATEFNIGLYNANMLAFSQQEDKISQIAGILNLQRNVVDNGARHTEYIRITFASNEVCNTRVDSKFVASCQNANYLLSSFFE